MKTIDVENLLGHKENYYKPGNDYLLTEYQKAIPYLTINEAVLLKNELVKKTEESDRKVGELERSNLILQTKFDEMEKKIAHVTELVTNRKR